MRTGGREDESTGEQQRNGLNVIYCNGSSSRGALSLKGLINSLRGINKVSLISQGAPGPSITILSPPQDHSTLSSQHSDNNTVPLVSVPPAAALKVFLLAPFLDKRLHFSLKVSDNVAPNNSPMIKNCTLLYTDPKSFSATLQCFFFFTWSRRVWAFSAGSSRSPAVALRTTGVLFHSRRGTVFLATFSSILTVCPAFKHRDNGF